MSESNGPRTVIGPDARVKGEIHSEGDLVVQGRVEGSLSVDAVLFIETAGVVEAEVNARHVVIAGAFQGNLVARDAAEVAKTGRVQGRVTAPRMLVADGGILNAEVCMSGEAAPAAETMIKGEAVEAAPTRGAPRSVYTYSVPETRQTAAPDPSRDQAQRAQEATVDPALNSKPAAEVVEAAVPAGPASKTKKGGKKKS